ncbi:MAG: Eco57I restriction-modification methylase domain-containing protein [Pseudomonadota bacterium]
MNSAILDELRQEANAKLNPKTKTALGQFMTPSRIAEFMAGLFTNHGEGARLLDAGAGIGSLTVAASKVLTLSEIDAWEIDPIMRSYLERNLSGLSGEHRIHAVDFIHDSVARLANGHMAGFTHAILNPPYKKIATSSEHRLACRQVGIETVNLYTAFLALAILHMAPLGEIVIIIPRSFCNGPYYKPFRELMLEKCSIDHIHIFESRNKAFEDDQVLQENIIVKLVRGKPQGPTTLSFSHDATFAEVHERTVHFDEIVKPKDLHLFIHIPTEVDSNRCQAIFSRTLSEIGLAVRTGPVVDFRVKAWWSENPTDQTAPLLYPHHFTPEKFTYPRAHKKPNALIRSTEVDKWLMPSGFYVIAKRFSAKEERRRVVAYLVSPSDLEAEMIGFENHWNVFHVDKHGMDEETAKGLVCFLNSTQLDDYFRVFSGHTQVNATDLRHMKYPTLAQLRQLGTTYRYAMPQDEIDDNLDRL